MQLHKLIKSRKKYAALFFIATQSKREVEVFWCNASWAKQEFSPLITVLLLLPGSLCQSLAPLVTDTHSSTNSVGVGGRHSHPTHRPSSWDRHLTAFTGEGSETTPCRASTHADLQPTPNRETRTSKVKAAYLCSLSELPDRQAGMILTSCAPSGERGGDFSLFRARTPHLRNG